MGRPPHGGGPVFRFTQSEVVEMESCLNEVNNAIPTRDTICALAERFSLSAERAGKIVVQPKQVWNWFQNKRYAQRVKPVKSPGKLSISPMPRDELLPFRNVGHSIPVPSGKIFLDSAQVEFEAKSARDGAWYDVAAFLSHRMFETGDPEVRVRFSGFGEEEDEWINVRKYVRQRSLPCEAGECVVVLAKDLILCFQEGKEQALYFDAHVLDAQRRRHDVRGCRCRFLVRYDHDQSEEIVPLRKVCRRPETDYRLQILASSKASASADPRLTSKDPNFPGSSKETNLSLEKPRKQRKLMDVNTDEVTRAPLPTAGAKNYSQPAQEVTAAPIPTSAAKNNSQPAPEVITPPVPTAVANINSQSAPEVITAPVPIVGADNYGQSAPEVTPSPLPTAEAKNNNQSAPEVASEGAAATPDAAADKPQEEADAALS